MDFTFTDEQRMIRDTAEAFLAEVSTGEAVRTAMDTELGYDPELWQRICNEMYWQAIHIPEEYGGMGLGYVELVAMLEQMGRHLLCAPFFSTVCLAANHQGNWSGPVESDVSSRRTVGGRHDHRQPCCGESVQSLR